MIILGIGSNIGFPLANLRRALTLLKKTPAVEIIEISSVYISDAQLPENAPNTWEKSYLNIAISCRTTLPPSEFHEKLQAIELQMGREKRTKWAPRIIDIDILAWGDLHHDTTHLSIPHPSLLTRPFALLPLLEIAAHWQPPETFCDPEILKDIDWLQAHHPIPFNTRKIPHRLDAPLIMGILNITPDSFSDGGQFNQPDRALQQIEAFIHAGAEIIDIGAESTRPGATPITPELEWERLEPVLALVHSAFSHPSTFDPALLPKVSLDTYHFSTVHRALEKFPTVIHIINDVSGQDALKIASLLSQEKYRHIQYVSMHNLGVPADPAKTLPATVDPVKVITDWTRKHIDFLQQSGLQPHQIIIDIGIGFGLTLPQNWSLLSHTQEIKAALEPLDIPLLIGHSRKSFLKPLLNATSNTQNLLERDILTSMISFHLAQKGVDILRVHSVQMTNQAMRIHALLKPLNT